MTGANRLPAHDMSLVETRRAASDLVDAIVDNMRRNLEPLKYTTLAASRYTVYLSASEYARLEGILPRLRGEAVRALDEALQTLNAPSFVRRHVSWWPRRPRPFENAGNEWHVEFLCDPDGELANEGDIVVHSDLMLPAAPELGVGERTRRITTVRTATGAIATERTPAPERMLAPEARPASATIHARLTYTDNDGKHAYAMVADAIRIGRGGITYPVDLRLATSEDVSREHACIRRDPRTGEFVLVDLSSLGTTLNGRHIPRGFVERDGLKAENGAFAQLPDRARIGLAETVFLDFERVRS